MLLISQNISNYDISIPADAIYRINLAWCNSLDELKKILKKHENNEIFLDLPIGRIKPPNNKYTLEEIVPILESNNQIKFFAISNVERKEDLEQFQNLLPKRRDFDFSAALA